MAPPPLPFFKMNGTGNSILVVDARDAGTAVSPPMARAMADSSALSFDQLMAIEAPRSAAADAFVTIFNADGSEAGACGNGTRCVAWALMRHAQGSRLTLETRAGLLDCERIGATRFAVDMGAPGLGWQDIPLASQVPDTDNVVLAPVEGLPADFRHCAAVGMGNPHAVFFVPSAGVAPLGTVGPIVEHHPMFPQRANVSFAEVVSRDALRLRVWERSAGPTLACGSAACATTVAAVRRGLANRRVAMTLPGGVLEIEWRAADDHVVMTGDVELEHVGILPSDLWGLAS